MKKMIFLLMAFTWMGHTTATAAMSVSKVRKEARFLTDKMGYELNLSNAQYNDVYEINYDFIYSIRNVMDDVVRGYDWAMEEYYTSLDFRNDDLRYVLNQTQYRRFLQTDYFYRPIYASGASGLSGYISRIPITVISILINLIITRVTPGPITGAGTAG